MGKNNMVFVPGSNALMCKECNQTLTIGGDHFFLCILDEMFKGIRARFIHDHKHIKVNTDLPLATEEVRDITT